VVVILTAVVRIRYGGGQPYPDLTTTPLFGSEALEEVAAFDEPIGNVAVSATNRLFFTIHPESRPENNRLMEWENGAARPWPDANTQRELFQSVLGVVIDRQGRLWTIDHGNHGFGTPRLLAFDLVSGEVVHRHHFDRRVAPRGSFLQDLQVSPDGTRVYIADASFWRKRPGIVVYDVTTEQARRVLDRHQSVTSQDWIIRTPSKTMVFFGGLAALKPGVDGIALEPSGDWLYFGAMTHDTLFRVATPDLDDPDMSPGQLAGRLEVHSHKPLSDGLSADVAGNVYITDVEHGAVMRAETDRRPVTLIRDDRIRWADALSFGPGGWLYVADSAIPDQVLRSKRHIRNSAPYSIFRFQPGFEGVPGQ
jgi:sugar lactone lactonase YvrE